MTLNLLLILTTLAASQPTVIPPATGSPAAAYRKGSIDWSVLAGGALPVDLEGARSDRRLTLAAIELGRVMTGPLGPGPLRGQFEMLIQVMPVIVRGPEEFWGVGISPLFFRWSFSGAERVRPFAEVSAGLMLIDWAVPGVSRVVRNFNEQAGVGLRVGGASGRGLIIGYRFQHISNGDPDIPSPAIDTHLAYVGFSLVR
jgi:hypothetical protein